MNHVTFCQNTTAKSAGILPASRRSSTAWSVPRERPSAAAAAMPPTEEEREASTLDVASQQIFAMLDAFPRFKDLAADLMRPADQEADVRGCILFTGPLKMLQTVAMVTQAGKASTAPERFKPLQIFIFHQVLCLV